MIYKFTALFKQEKKGQVGGSAGKTLCEAAKKSDCEIKPSIFQAKKEVSINILNSKILFDGLGHSLFFYDGLNNIGSNFWILGRSIEFLALHGLTKPRILQSSLNCSI